MHYQLLGTHIYYGRTISTIWEVYLSCLLLFEGIIIRSRRVKGGILDVYRPQKHLDNSLSILQSWFIISVVGVFIGCFRTYVLHSPITNTSSVNPPMSDSRSYTSLHHYQPPWPIRLSLLFTIAVIFSRFSDGSFMPLTLWLWWLSRHPFGLKLVDSMLVRTPLYHYIVPITTINPIIVPAFQPTIAVLAPFRPIIALIYLAISRYQLSFPCLSMNTPSIPYHRNAYWLLEPLAYCMWWSTCPFWSFALSFGSSCTFWTLATTSIRPHTSFQSGDTIHILIATQLTSNTSWCRRQSWFFRSTLVYPYWYHHSPPQFSALLWLQHSLTAGYIWYISYLTQLIGWQISYIFSINILRLFISSILSMIGNNNNNNNSINMGHTVYILQHRLKWMTVGLRYPDNYYAYYWPSIHIPHATPICIYLTHFNTPFPGGGGGSVAHRQFSA